MRSAKLIAAGLLWTLALAGPAHAQGIDNTCSLALTKTDPATVNAAYPDEAAIYWVGTYQAVPGTRLRITGRYPHARYFSFNVYDLALRPIDAIADVEILPDAGASNPFARGARRDRDQRDYTAFVDFGAPPQERAPNTVYTGKGQSTGPNLQGTLILRTYIPDAGLDETGGVGLPTVTLERTADGGQPAESACAGLAKPPVSGVSEAFSDAGLPAAIPGSDLPGQPTPVWVKFRNLVQVANQIGTNNPFLDDFTGPLAGAEAAGGDGGFLSNVHNAYVYAAVNRSYGDVSVTRMRVPSVPDTRPGARVMPSGQLRYFSMCTNDFGSQRFIGCATDDQTAVGVDGFAAYVVSTRAARPEWATAECGYTWLPFGPNTSSLLILRHMLPDPGFAQAIQRAEPLREADTMGDFLPTTRYLKAGETPKCRALASAENTPPSGPKVCVSKRRFTITLPRRLRSARIKVGGRRVEVRRSGRRLRATINLRGRARGKVRVRIRGRARNGEVVRSVRTYRTCGRHGGRRGRGGSV